MATAFDGRPAGSWQPADFQFHPYDLTAERLTTVEPAACPKRKAGRQKRTSIQCQVPGCPTPELIDAKTYYKRYRICVHHCGAPVMVLDGLRVRFCQQCGRFHDLAEFEGARKSCRRKLKRHNERRRAPPAKCGEGGWGSGSGGEPNADSEDDAEAKALANLKHASTRARARTCRDKLLSQPSDEPATSRPGPRAAPRTGAALGAATVAAGAAQQLAPGLPEASPHSLTERVLHAAREKAGNGGSNTSTLVAPPLSSRDTSESAGPSSPDPTACVSAPPQPGSLPASPADILQALEGVELMDMAVFDDFDHDLGLGFLFPEDPSDLLVLSATPHHRPHVGSSPVPPASSPVPPASSPVPAASLPLQPSVDKLPLMPPPLDIAEWRTGGGGPPAAGAAPAAPGPAPQWPQPQTAFHVASSMLTGGATPPLVGYVSHDRLALVSLKVFNCTPDALLPAVRAELECLVGNAYSMLEGYIRPGCVHVSLSALLPAAGGDGRLGALALGGGGVAAAVRDLLERRALGPNAGEAMVVQAAGQVVVVKRQRVVAVVDAACSAGVVPRLAAVRPLAAAAAPRCSVLLAGQRISGPADLVLCRQQGRHVTLELCPAVAAAGGALEGVEASALGLAPGLAEFEVQRGAILSAPRPLLVLPRGEDDAAAEFRQLEDDRREGGGAAGGPPTDVDGLLRDAGLVVQYLDRTAAAAAGRAVPDYTPQLLARIQGMACRLVAAATARGWAATVRLLLPAVTAAGQAGGEAAAAMDAACPSGSTLMHVAVGTGAAPLVEELARWARGAGAAPRLAADVRGRGGVTPLHLAALLPPGQRDAVRAALASTTPSSISKLWGLVQAEDGITPEAMAAWQGGGAAGSATAAGPTVEHAAHRAGPGPFGAPAEACRFAEEDAGGSVPSSPGPLPPLRPHKQRHKAKRELDNLHIEGLVRDVVRVVRPSSQEAAGAGAGLGTCTLGVSLAVGAGLAAVLLHVLS